MIVCSIIAIIWSKITLLDALLEMILNITLCKQLALAKSDMPLYTLVAIVGAKRLTSISPFNGFSQTNDLPLFVITTRKFIPLITYHTLMIMGSSWILAVRSLV